MTDAEYKRLTEIIEDVKVGNCGCGAMQENVDLVCDMATKYAALLPMLAELVEARGKLKVGELFYSTPDSEEADAAGLCQIDDGCENSGWFVFETEWHQGEFITKSANTITQIAAIIKTTKEEE